MAKKTSVKKRKVTIALQGGGAHGALAWGMLDRLLEDDRIEIEAISGASAGAMNGAALASGLVKGGNKEARKSLKALWKGIGNASPFRGAGTGNLDNNPAFIAMEWMRRWFTPSQLNPTNYNPLRKILNNAVDFKALKKTKSPKLFFSAVDVKAGALKIFRNKEMSTEALLASGALPDVFAAAKVNGRDYWDGGFMANPDLDPLLEECTSRDIIVIQINPISRKKTPKTMMEIVDRQNEISMNANLLMQMRGIQKRNILIKSGNLKSHKKGRYRTINLHRIGAQEMENYNITSKMNTDPIFLKELFEMGRKTADKWIKDNFDTIGKKSSFKLDGRHIEGEQINPKLPQITEPNNKDSNNIEPKSATRRWRRPLRPNKRGIDKTTYDKTYKKAFGNPPTIKPKI